jgi:2'-5' RNA ligase
MGTWIEARPNLVIPGIINTYEGDEAHITMAYLGDANPAQVQKMMQDTEAKPYLNHGWPAYGSLLCDISGTAQWRDAKNNLFRVLLVQPSLLMPNNPTIYEEQNRIVAKLTSLSGIDGFPVVSVDKTYPFVPHITLPDKWQDNSKERCNHGVQYSTHLPVISGRVVFGIDALYVTHVTDKGDYRHSKI